MNQKVTIIDIAKEAGVSIATVSRVLTGNAKVNSEKYALIKEIIEKYNFRPNLYARRLKQTQTNVIGIMTADIRNPFYAALFISCEQAATEAGYNLMLCNTFSDRLNEFSMIENFANQQVDAIILLGGAPDDLVTDEEYASKVKKITESIPVIVSGKLQGTDCTCINVDMKKAMTLVMERISKIPDVKKIAFVGGNKQVATTVLLRDNFKDLLKEYNLPYFSELDLFTGTYDDAGGYNGMMQLLNQKEIPDVVIAVNDFTAVGALKAIFEKGLKVPDDIKIISFEDTYLATITNPPLTTVSYNYKSYGTLIIDNAVKLINGVQTEEDILVEPKLIVRQTC